MRPPWSTRSIFSGAAANDRAVLAAYGLAPDTPEPEIVAHLFKLYSKIVADENDVRQL